MADVAQEPAPESAHPETDQRPDFADVIRSQAASYVTKRKEDVARAVSDVAEAIRNGGARFEGAPHLKAFFDSGAEGVEELSADINRRTTSELYDEVEAAIRRRPTVTFAAAALAGFALFRFLKASKIRPIPRSRSVVPVDVFPTPDI
ncbi:hypothetical protein [Methylobacterium oxalidis]|uniref:Uncharacterized protein n=1 Tax=Methylobacterium oxalidis TaxID=944322 RepID=A0A512IX81_9HYPH|nr:hypothetical protein [Methylobacterium oxalidis]GEP02327.1 hypothetical protein MOX02_03650 [Methylobacterium oxalidis]GJE31166.1 hypothetical protein LDDCCGHA_1342 [Methylobacterium oxalidis]GLS67706.1 hypothetical protein GCM10007888_60910 [Methylobacterium oxalidis]